MSNKSKLSIFWKFIGGIGVILSIVASLLQVYEIFDFAAFLYNMTISLWAFLFMPIPLYYAIVGGTVCLILFLTIRYSRRRSSRDILDFSDARRIALLCRTPRTTEYLRNDYNYRQIRSNIVFAGGYGFDDYMKRLEKEGFLKYVEGKWQVTQEALDYIEKYHGE